ncbi:Serine/threonine-protein kinase N1 [Frankliniella fusca]|uniref:Serine/threonine-protein kinase N1 n=1 Tax=Frankliniella fusca TaxID=407009 RepID=A0AAE1HWP8_9NEOP|nr:Serine/threonine-protein kinase N1 [Frankliniella fusca]
MGVCPPWPREEAGPPRAADSTAAEAEACAALDEAVPQDEEEAVNLTPDTLEEALQTIGQLQLRAEARGAAAGGAQQLQVQAEQLLKWRRRALAYEEALAALARSSQDQLQVVSGQLMLLKARLVRKQKDIGRMLAQREAVIQRQARTIQLLQTRLQEAGLDLAAHGDLDSPTGETNLDSLNDSDSAVIMEDGHGSDQEHPVYLRGGGGAGGTPVARSVSDAVESPTTKWRQQQYQRTNNCSFNYLRRPEVLETVYSVEEDGEGEGAGANAAAATAVSTAPAAAATTADAAEHERVDTGAGTGTGTGPGRHSRRASSQSCKGDSNSSLDDTASVDESSCSTATPGRAGYQYGSLEVLTDPAAADPPRVPPGPNHVVTYNRVMSNHRSVTKPKDVKYKRINKAKSKSLEELRGRLRNWVDKGITSSKFISLDQSYA